MRAWLEQYQSVLSWLAGVSVATALVTLLAIPFLIARIPEDYFATPQPPPAQKMYRQPVVRLLFLIVKNLLGLILLLAGLAMLVLPGQGVLTLLAGLMLLDFPGKRRLELWIVRQPRVERSLNWIRARSGKSAFIISKNS